MSKKDYVQFANLLRDIKQLIPTVDVAIAANLLAFNLCDVLENDNERFDRKRFLAYIDRDGTNQAN